MADMIVTVVFILNGEDVPVEANVNAPLHAAVGRALERGHASGRPLGDWEVRDERGRLLDQARKLADYQLQDGARLFLTVAVGAGGDGA